MRSLARFAAGAAIAGGIALAAVNAPALGQPAPHAGPPGAEAAPGGPPPPMHRGHRGPHGPHGGPGWDGPRGGPGGPGMGGPGGPFARLFAAREDKALTPDEVRRIVEGFLLWMGERDWRVVDVAEGPDNTVTFGLAASQGNAFMRFAMDRKTGRVRRVI